MRSFSLITASLAILSGCATLGREETKSDWAALSEAKNLDCKDLPLLPEDLRIEKVHVISSTGPSLLLEVSSRRGVRSFYHLAYRSLGDLEPTKLVRLPIDQGASFLGAGILGHKAVFAVHTQGKKSKPVVQIRELSNNVLLSEQSIKFKGAIEVGSWQVVDGRIFALVREHKDDEATDDQPYLRLEVPLAGGGKGPQIQASKVVSAEADTFVDGQGRRWIIALDKGPSSAKKDPRFRLSPWQPSKNETGVELDEKGPIESWDFQESTEQLYLAFVKGDSLLWENTALEVASLSRQEPFGKSQQASLPLSRVHVAQPLLASAPAGSYVFLPQWLDHELSVATYKISGGSLETLGYQGVFKEGTAIEAAYFHEPSSSFQLLSRFRSGGVQRYSLCQVEF